MEILVKVCDGQVISAEVSGNGPLPKLFVEYEDTKPVPDRLRVEQQVRRVEPVRLDAFTHSS